MPTTTTPLVLYVYHCDGCDRDGQLHLEETAPDVKSACSVCGAEVLAEWDGGVELTTNEPPTGGRKIALPPEQP
ncbi:zinc ribbon domain-containing protein [Pseudomonas sp. MWU12-2323]|uniref:zinc ribbon domain-containing protein n=1 Tax=Pseudomonas sp. MWU12-2323 TaxID=2651296 RepID=UPI00128CF5A4|nr:zinc ribbon domain-containing protein [Pseudomonas sp. MWU12-2323]MPQ71521.1 zinc ribbon domain-containing protein [Pseudomonas sp. MWU12-2323]